MTNIDKIFILPSNLKILSIFRILIGFHMIKKMISQFSSFDLLYSNKAFASSLESISVFNFNVSSALISNNYKLFISIYFILAILILLGWRSNIIFLITFFFNIFFSRIGGGYLMNGGDNWLHFVFFYMSFCNTNKFYSLSIQEPNQLSNIFTKVFSKSISIHLCIIYFFAGFYKIEADVWHNGVAMHYILQLERFCSDKDIVQFIINSPNLIVFLTYFVVLFEITFPIILFNIAIRNIYVIFGVLFHAGIYWIMMIHDFALVFIFSYLLFFKDEEIDSFFQYVSRLVSYAKRRLIFKTA